MLSWRPLCLECFILVVASFLTELGSQKQVAVNVEKHCMCQDKNGGRMGHSASIETICSETPTVVDAILFVFHIVLLSHTHLTTFEVFFQRKNIFQVFPSLIAYDIWKIILPWNRQRKLGWSCRMKGDVSKVLVMLSLCREHQ